MPGPRRSEDEPVVSGERESASGLDRRVDTGRIVVMPMPAPRAPSTPIAGLPVRTPLPNAPERRTSGWLVVLVYVLSVAALGYAIWERFLR